MAADDLTIQAGVRTGGGNAPNIGAGMPPDETGAALKSLAGFAKLATDTLAPIIEQEKNRAFVQGVTEVMQRRTTQQIAEEQPAWARTFGDNFAVQGARLQEAQSYGTRFVNRVAERMPELRKLSQEEFSKHVADTMEQDLPTDPQAALLAKQRVVQSLPGLTSQWSRENVQWKQEEAMVNYTTHLQAETQLLKTGEEAKRLHPFVIDPELDAAARARYQAALALPPGMDPKLHHALVNKIVTGAVGSPGGIGFWNYLKETGHFDALDQVTQDQVMTQLGQTVRRAIPEADKIAADNGLMGARAGLFADAWKTKNPEEFLLAGADALNKKYAALSGLSDELHPFVTPEAIGQGLGQVERKLDSEEAKRKHAELVAANKAATAATKAQTKALRLALNPPPEEQAALVFSLVQAGGNPGDAMAWAKGDTRIKHEGMRMATDLFFNQNSLEGVPLESPEFQQRAQAQAKWITAMTLPGTPLPSASVTNRLLQPLQMGGSDRQLQESLAVMALLPPPVRVQVFGAQGDKLVNNFSNALNARNATRDPVTGKVTDTTPLKDLFAQAQIAAAAPSLTPLGGADGRAIAADFTSKAPGLNSEQAAKWGAVMANVYHTLDHIPEAQRKAAARSLSHGVMFPMGEWAVQNGSPNSDSSVLFTTTEKAPDGTTVTVPHRLDGGQDGAALSYILRQRGVPPGAQVAYRADNSGSAVFYVEWLTPTGQRRTESVRGLELLDWADQRNAPGFKEPTEFVPTTAKPISGKRPAPATK